MNSLIAELRQVGRAGMRCARKFGFHTWRFAHHLFRRDGKAVLRVYDKYELYANVDDYRSYRIWRTHGSQREKVHALRDILEHGTGLFIDIGANYGEFSLIPAASAIPCVLFEPNPLVYERLRETMSRFTDARVFPYAAGQADGTAEFSYCRMASGSGSFSASTPTEEAKYLRRDALVEKIFVPIKRLDHFVIALGLSVEAGFVMKVDVEGFEREVLVGAEQLLAEAPWWRALVEFSPRAIANAGKSVEEEWVFIGQFQGKVINRLSSGHDPLGTLPKPAPGQDVDVLIGKGNLPTAASRPKARTAS